MITKKKNFKEETKSLFFKYTVIPILILFLVFFMFTLFIFKMKVIYDANQAAKNIELQMTLVYQTYFEEIQRMSESPPIITYLEKHRNSHLVYEEFYKFNNQQKVKSAFHLVDEKGVFLASTAIPADATDTTEEILDTIIPRIQKEPSKMLIDASTTDYSHGRKTVFTFGQAIKVDKQIIGYIIYQLFEEDIQNLIFGQKADIAVITDQYDHIIVTTNGIVRGLMNKFNPEITSDSYVNIKNEKYFMSETHTSDTTFRIYTLKSIKYDELIIVLYFGFITIIGVILYFLVKYLAEKMSSQNVQSIEKLITAVSSLQKGDFHTYVKIDTGDEFEILADQYNVMVDNLNELSKKNKELSDIRRINEIKFLQSQFNPHFLFNVLDTLRYTMILDTKQAQEIIITLASLLRYSIKNEVQNVLFQKDLNYIIDYLKLHKYRFNERLTYQVEISAEIKNSLVPKLLIQPIIENAIKYGYQNQTHLDIIIKGEVSGDDLTLLVKDNGSGIEKEKLKEIKAGLKHPQIPQEHIGLYNAHKRLVVLYGEDYGLNIRSVYGEGTEVEIKLPYHKGEGRDV